MQHFLERPNLPMQKVTTAVVSCRNPEFIQILNQEYHIETILPESLTAVQGEERYHADMIVCHLGANKFIVSTEAVKTRAVLCRLGGTVMLSDGISGENPLLNGCIVGKRLICNTKRTDKSILQYCKDNDFTVLHTKQRYSRCSTAVINEDAVITADPSIYRICKADGMDVLKIREGYIHLEGYPYGFIGGCCGLTDRDTLLFCGKIADHPDYKAIKDFALTYGVHIEYAGNFPLTDIGGILPVMELAEPAAISEQSFL